MLSLRCSSFQQEDKHASNTNMRKFDLNTQYQRVPVTQNNNLLRNNLI